MSNAANAAFVVLVAFHAAAVVVAFIIGGNVPEATAVTWPVGVYAFVSLIATSAAAALGEVLSATPNTVESSTYDE